MTFSGIIQENNWPENWSDVPPGTEIAAEVYEDLFNTLPPIFLRHGPGFQMGEPHDHWEDAQGRFRPRFLTFVRIDGRCYYAGLHFAGECSWQITRENSAFPSSTA